MAAPLTGWALQRLVEFGSPRYETIGTSPALEQALPTLEQGIAELVVLATAPVSLSELAAFCSRVPARALLVTDSVNGPWLEAALRAGVQGVVSTAAAPEAFLAALEKVAHGEHYLPGRTRGIAPAAAHRVPERLDMDQRRIASLTARERAAVAAIAADPAAQGKLIARRLGISEHTLRNHLTSVYSKLGVANRVALYSYALQHGLVATAHAECVPTPAARPADRVAASRPAVFQS